MARKQDERNRGRDELVDENDDLIELACYPGWADVDMFAPRLEDAGIHYEARELARNPDDHSDGVEPRITVQLLVPRRELRAAREVLEDFESQRDVADFEIRARPEPEDIGRDEDMNEPPQPKMKF